jgi:hypothetical protein
MIRLVKMAFQQAEIGDEAKAREFWAAAIDAGYDPDEKNAKGFEIAIAKGLRNPRR